MADNGGIRAAYNAFEAHRDFWGPDDQLVSAIVVVDTHPVSARRSSRNLHARAVVLFEFCPSLVRNKSVARTVEETGLSRSGKINNVLNSCQSWLVKKSRFNCRSPSPNQPNDV